MKKHSHNSNNKILIYQNNYQVYIVELQQLNHNEMANVFVFGNYAAIAANMPSREFRAPNVVSERSKTFV